MWSWKTRKTVDVDCPRSEASPITWDFPTLPTHFYKNVGATISPPVHCHELLQGLVFRLCRCDFFGCSSGILMKKNFIFFSFWLQCAGFLIKSASSKLLFHIDWRHMCISLHIQWGNPFPGRTFLCYISLSSGS